MGLDYSFCSSCELAFPHAVLAQDFDFGTGLWVFACDR